MKPILAAAALAALAASPAFAALKEGDAAPDFAAPAFLAGKATTFKLSDALKKGPVVVYFFPAAYTRGCDIEAHLFSEASDDYKAQGATVVGVTAGNTDKLQVYSADTKTCGGKFTVAADPDLKIAKSYDAAMGPAMPTISSRTSYVIGKDGKVAHVYSAMSPDKHVEETLGAVKSLKMAKK